MATAIKVPAGKARVLQRDGEPQTRTGAMLGTDDMRAFLSLPEGASRGTFGGRSWIATRNSAAEGRRHWLYAEAAGGTAFVSANIFRLSNGRSILKPCEMPADDVVAFLRDFRIERTG